MSASISSIPPAHLSRLSLAASVFFHTRNGVMLTALDGSILAVNRAFTEITGYTEEEVAGKNPRILRSGRQGPEFYQAMWHSIKTQGFWKGEAWNKRKDGSHFVEDITVSVVPDEHGQPSHYMAVFSDITAATERRTWLEQRSYFDALTGLPNRTLLMERLTKAIEMSKATNVEVAVAFIDLDGFKEVNDRFGHEAGDQLLVQTSQRLAEALRKSDTLSRFGGDEFVAVLPDVRDGIVLAEVMKRMLAAGRIPANLKGTEVQISASIGVAFYPSDATTPEELLRIADTALYVAKREGRDCYRACRPKVRLQIEKK
jgi:diguanylate cyclase (GGDEF)-like protein/PAS domain S-box-containing protein